MGKSQPDNIEQVIAVMKEYILKKKFTFSESQIEYMAEDFYLYFEGRSWDNIRYWPSVAMRWVLNSVTKFGSQPVQKEEPKSNEPTLRDKILGNSDNVI